MAPDKILHIIGGGELGGAEQHVLNLLENLERDRFSPALACLVDGPLAILAREKGIEAATFPMHHPLDLSPLPALVRWVRAEHVALIHCHGSRANLLGRLAARWLGLPNLSTVHSSLAKDYISPFAAQMALWLEKLTLPLSSGQIAVSQYLAEELSARGGRNIRVIHNGYPVLPPYDPKAERAKYRQHWSIPADAQVIGAIARFHPAKGHTILIQAAKLLQPQFPHLHLLLIGDGPLKTEISTVLDRESLPHTLTGFLPEAYRALPAMDLFVLPSVSEGLGLVLLEAMQRRIPIVASLVGGIPEVVRPSQDGLLVPPKEPEALAQACARLLSQPSLAETLVQSAAARWPAFSLEGMVAKTQEVYTQYLTHPSILHSPLSGR